VPPVQVLLVATADEGSGAQVPVVVTAVGGAGVEVPAVVPAAGGAGVRESAAAAGVRRLVFVQRVELYANAGEKKY